MKSWRLRALLVVLVVLAATAYLAVPYVRATSLIVRAANLGGAVEAFANERASRVTKQPRHMVPTRYGEVPAQFYVPDGTSERTILLVPGIHSMGIDEHRLNGLASDMAGSGVTIMAMALPDLQHYRITPRATDTIEDAVTWMAARRDLAPDGRVAVVGVSFAGGLAVAAASRPALRDKLSFVFSFGGHGDLPRVMRYLATGETPDVPGVEKHPPHDYGVAVILYGLADRGVVPTDQVEPLRRTIETFLLASQLTRVDTKQADAMFARARELTPTLAEPSRTYMSYVNDRAVTKLGAVLEPHLNQLGADDPALSPNRLTSMPTAPIYLLHGDDDTVIPASESALLGEYLKAKGATVDVLLTGLLTHAEVNPSAAASETWKLVSFWAQILKL